MSTVPPKCAVCVWSWGDSVGEEWCKLSPFRNPATCEGPREVKNEMKTFYLTFGVSHPLGDCWVEVEALDREAARDLVFQYFGKHWAFIYDEDDFQKQYCPAGRAGKVLR